jgi:SAM-dependent methyltransferase
MRALLEVHGAPGASSSPQTLLVCPQCTIRHFDGLVSRPFSGGGAFAPERGFELALGLRGSIECLARVDLPRGSRLLEVGCGTGFTLDFAREQFGCEVLGIDPSDWSTVAEEQLDLHVVHGFLGKADGVPEASWDVVYACEVVEHVVDQAGFMASVRRSLAPGGVFLLRTPDAEQLAPGRDPRVTAAMLSPGFHPVLHSATSLQLVLAEAGFDEIEIITRDDTLHAAASDRPFRWEPDAELSSASVTAYLRGRSKTLPHGCAARLGTAQALASHALALHDLDMAGAALADLDTQLRSRHGVGLLDPAPAAFAAAAAPLYCHGYGTAGTLAAALGRHEDAIAFFRCAVEAGEAASVDRHVADLALEIALQTARIRLIALDSAADRAAARRELNGLLALTGSDRRPFALDAFACCAASGALDLADGLADEIAQLLRDGATNPAEREVEWLLAMVLLHNRGDAPGAAQVFARVARDVAQPEGRRRSARFHEGYSRWQAGDRAEAAAILGEIVTAKPATGDPGELTQARAILATM